MTRVLDRAVKHLTRVRQSEGPTLYFTFPGAPRARRHNVTFVKPEHVPEFEGEAGWFEMEKIQAKPWSYWRGVRQVEPPRR
jgi:hypothetical protein